MSITYQGTIAEQAQNSNGIMTIRKNLKYVMEYPDESRHLLNDPNIPNYLAEYPENGFRHLRLKSMIPQLISGDWKRGIWVVVLTYNDDLSDVENLSIDKTLFPWERKPINVSYGTKQFVVDHDKAYREDDEQFNPTKPVTHPITKEVIPAQKEIIHNTISFTYFLQDFDYSWKKEFEGTVNRAGIRLLSVPFDARVLVIEKLNIKKDVFVGIDGSNYDYFIIDIEIEDLGQPYSNELPLLGYMMKSANKVYHTQLRNGVYGYYNEFKKEWNVQEKIYIDKHYGQPAQIDDDIDDDYYEDYPARYAKNWETLGLPEEL